MKAKSIQYLKTWMHHYYIAQRYTKQKNGKEYSLAQLMKNSTISDNNEQRQKNKDRLKNFKYASRPEEKLPYSGKQMNRYTQRLQEFRRRR